MGAKQHEGRPRICAEDRRGGIVELTYMRRLLRGRHPAREWCVALTAAATVGFLPSVAPSWKNPADFAIDAWNRSSSQTLKTAVPYVRTLTVRGVCATCPSPQRAGG
jgi:hypothetical protein